MAWVNLNETITTWPPVGGTDATVGDLLWTVDTYTQLRALDSTYTDDISTVVRVGGRTSVGDGGGGDFYWVTGNQSANVTADTQSGIWVAPTSASTGASGAWKRTVHEYDYHADWFGGDITAAIAVLPSTGGTINLAKKTYGALSSAITKDGVKLKGAGRPTFKSDGTGLEGGTIIKGPLIYRANNLEFSDLGVDSGSAVCTADYAGVAQEGLICTVANLSGVPQLTGLVVNNVIAICQSASAAVHAFACEGYTRAQVNNVETLFGTHGQAYKVLESQVTNIRSRGNGSEGVVIKSDATRQCKRSTFTGIRVLNYSSDTLNGIDIQAQGAQEVSDIIIDDAICDGIGTGLKLTCTSTLIRDITITNSHFNSCSVDGVSTTGAIKRIKFIGCTANTNTQFGFTESADADNVSYTACQANNNASGFVCFGINTDLVACEAMDNTSYGYFAKTGASVYKVANRGSGNGTSLYGADANVVFYNRQTPDSVTAPTLAGTWVNYDAGTNTQAGYWIDDDNKVYLRGLVKDGALGTIFTLPAGYRPNALVRFPVTTLAGAVVTLGEVYVSAAGVVTLAAGGTAYVSLDGIFFRAVN